MLLNEVLNKPYKWKFHKKSKREWGILFKTDVGEQYHIVLFYSADDEAWMLSFGNVSGYDEPEGVLNTGDEFRVFATVIAVVTEFLKEIEPERLYFTAKEKSRNKLYRRLIDKFANKMGYYATKQPTGEFELVRK